MGELHATGTNGSYGSAITFRLDSENGNRTLYYDSNGNFDSLVAGYYTVFAKDGDDCTARQELTISETCMRKFLFSFAF